MDNIYCPYCGAPMSFEIINLERAAFHYTCKTCNSESPLTVGQPQETTIALARKRMPPEPRLYTLEELQDPDFIPTVIWVEEKGREPCAGVWTGEYYEMQTGEVMESPHDELIQAPAGSYNTRFRFWDSYPDKRYRDENEWDECPN